MPGIRIAGVDEAGRGPLAGPVVAAAVILDPGRPVAGLDDSKKLNAKLRARLEAEIRDRAIGFAVAEANVEEIDQLNILQATLLAMRRALESLPLRPSLALIDGNRLPEIDGMALRAVVGGDGREPAISAASILAKEHRDRIMLELDRSYPEYGLARHKGYPTPAHLAVLRRIGPCPAHRRSFLPVRQAALFS